MPKPTPVQRLRRRRAGLVFVPPLVMFAFGAYLLWFAPNESPAATETVPTAPTPTASASTIPDPSDSIVQRIAELRPEIDQAGSILYLVNKTRPFDPVDYEPADLVEIPNSESIDNSRGLELAAPAASALADLAEAMQTDGVGQLFINSAFRSYETQVDLFAAKVEQYGEKKALIHSAKPGHSEHQSGLAVDVSLAGGSCAILACFGQTEAGKWLAENGWQFGFVIRYPDGWQTTTGYTYEPWHLRYVGVEVATLFHESRKGTLEDFWGLPPAPDYPQ